MKITLVKPQLSSDYQYIQQSHLLYTQHVGQICIKWESQPNVLLFFNNAQERSDCQLIGGKKKNALHHLINDYSVCVNVSLMCSNDETSEYRLFLTLMVIH